jgi:hypothetical protein
VSLTFLSGDLGLVCIQGTKLLTCLSGFVAFDQYKSLLQDAEGKISGPRTVIAGFGAGVTESLLAVTPFESIKTTLYVKPKLILPHC